MRHNIKLSLFYAVIIGSVLVSGCKDNIITPADNPPPVITSPLEDAWYACNATITYCWELPEGLTAGEVSGYELQFSNTQTPDGPWDTLRYFTSTCWTCSSCHQGIYETLYWRVRIVYTNGDRSSWAISYHQVGTDPEIIGSPPIITSPLEDAWYACNATITYCWELPEGVTAEEVSGYELQFSNTQTPDGPWDTLRYFTSTCWTCSTCHQGVYETLYWRVRIVYTNGDRSPWAISYHQVGFYPTDISSWE